MRSKFCVLSLVLALATWTAAAQQAAPAPQPALPQKSAAADAKPACGCCKHNDSADQQAPAHHHEGMAAGQEKDMKEMACCSGMADKADGCKGSDADCCKDAKAAKADCCKEGAACCGGKDKDAKCCMAKEAKSCCGEEDKCAAKPSAK
jgi:hypothetical protein